MKIEDLIGYKKTEFFDLVKENVDQELKFIGLNISHILVIGKFKIPGIVMQDLNKKNLYFLCQINHKAPKQIYV